MSNEIIEGEVIAATEKALTRRSGDAEERGVAVAVAMANLDVQITTAKAYPRSIQTAIDAITYLATVTTDAAMECNYALPRAGKVITGPSIRLMEIAANQWGNNRYGVTSIDIDRANKLVSVVGYHYDLQSNSYVEQPVTRRLSDSKGRLYNEDMIATTVNAAVSIAMRNAIKRGVPKQVWQAAYSAVLRVIAGDLKTIGARRVALLTAFQDEFGIKAQLVYQMLGVKGENDIGPDQLVQAAGFYSALRNNEITVEDLLRDVTAPKTTAGRTLGGAFGDAAQDKPKPQEAATAPAHDPQTGEISDDDHFPGDPKPDKPAAAPKADPKPKPAAKKADPVAQAIPGPAQPGAIYRIAGEGPNDEGRYVTYKDGEVFSSTPDPVKFPIHEEHAPKIAPEPEPETPAAEEQAPESPAQDDQTEGFSDSAEAQAALDALETDLQGAESYLQIKAALQRFRKTDHYVSGTAAYQRSARVLAYETTNALVETGRDPVRIENDPSFYALWLDVADRTEIDDVWMVLVRSPAYKALKEEQRDALAQMTMEAKGEDL